MYRFLMVFLGGLAVIALNSPAHALSKSAFKKQIVNKTVTMYHQKKDAEFIRYFSEDGTVTGVHPNQGYRRGQWTLSGKKLCIAWPGKPAKCRRFMKRGGKFGTANKKGKKMVLVFESYEEGNQIQSPKGYAAEDEAGPTVREELVTIPTRGKVTQTFLLMEPTTKPKGIVVFYPGHEGVVRFNKIGNQYAVDNEGGGLPAHEKSRGVMSRSGYVVALLAPPSDHKHGMDTAFRYSKKYAADARKVIEYLNKRYNQKVYLWGHCRSTFSPASITTKLNNENIKGVILSSTRSQGNRGSVMSLPKGAITIPILLVQHVDDPCEGTPAKNVPKLKTFYEAAASNVSVIMVSGGDGARPTYAPGCSGGYHAFRGMRKPVTKAIVKWLNQEEVPQHIME